MTSVLIMQVSRYRSEGNPQVLRSKPQADQQQKTRTTFGILLTALEHCGSVNLG